MPDTKLLPAVRVPTVSTGIGEDGEHVQETPIVDLPSAEKFGFAWPDGSVSNGTGAAPLPIAPTNELEGSEVDSSESESLMSRESTPRTGEKEPSDQSTPTNESPTVEPSPSPSQPTVPRLSRAFSMPAPSQLGHLNHPHRSPSVLTPDLPSPPLLGQHPSSSRYHELSVELADSVQMVIQTLLQISPPHLLDPAKEQFAACSLSVPSPSVSAMLTAMKNLNYMSANMMTLVGDSHGLAPARQSGFFPETRSAIQDDFDVGEMLQSVGDSLSGVVAQAGVDLVLYHADVGMKHVSVKGDECGISSALTHVRNCLSEVACYLEEICSLFSLSDYPSSSGCSGAWRLYRSWNVHHSRERQMAGAKELAGTSGDR